MNPAPGFRKHPDYRLAVSPAGQRVRVSFRGELIADTQNALAMKEGDYPVVYYFPRKDVRMERLERSSHRTHCPFKGDASYWTVAGVEDAAWSYEEPKESVAAIRGLLAFYPDRVTVELGSDGVAA